MMNLNLDTMNEQTKEISTEALMLDFIEQEENFYHDQQLFDSIEKLEFIKDQVKKYGVTDTIRDMIGDQIQYVSNVDLIEKIDIAIEGLISEVTGGTVDNTLKQIREFVDYFMHRRDHSIRGDVRVKFINIDETNPLAAYFTGVSSEIDAYAKKIAGNRVPTPEEINDFIDKLKGYLSTGHQLLRTIKPVEMSTREFMKNDSMLFKAASEIKSKLRLLDAAKILCPKKSTAKILNNLMKNTAEENDYDKKLYKSTENKKVNPKINSLIRAVLRTGRIALAKIFNMLKQIYNDPNNQ